VRISASQRGTKETPEAWLLHAAFPFKAGMTSLQGAETMELDTLQALYIEGLRDLYSAENQIIKALPKLRKNATHPELAEAFETHLEQTKEQVARLERIFEELGEKPTGKFCKGMEGLIAEADELLGEDAEPDVLDAGMISAAQHVEHYEMAGYGTVRTYAEMLGLEEQAQLLQQSLNEEEETDRLLTELAQSSVNIDAMTEAGDEEEEEQPAKSRSRSTSTSKTSATKKSSTGSRGTKTTSKGRSSTSRSKR
jgi:ferritin-like metal-binding protein YciE